jgi:hypothetical protein
MFHVGQMVVCVSEFISNEQGVTYPIKGLVYTVRGVEVSPLNGLLGLFLEEIVNERRLYTLGMREPKFWVGRFRPVRQTSIEQFTSILNQAPQREDA